MLLREAVHVVGETQALADVQEEPRAHALAEDGVQKVEGVAVRMEVAERTGAETDMRLFRVATPDEDTRAVERGWRRRGERPIKVGPKGKRRRDHAHRIRLLERPRRTDHEVRQAVARIGILEDVVARESRHRLFGAGDVPPQCMAGPDQLLEQVLHVVLRLVLVHAELLEDDHPLAFHISRIELGVAHDVEQDVEA